MIFSSLPVYLDALNSQQQLLRENFGSEIYDHHQPLPPLYPDDYHVSGVAAGSIRPGTMADRARQAKVPLPEGGLKCPRCESTNTKFCYFNNYSLSQPRHFCKTCRRYWTRGGALRNVPVGGGCRRNKNTKKNCSKSAAVSDGQPISNTDGTENTAASRSCSTTELIGSLLQPDLMASIQNNNNSGYGVGNIGLNSGAEKETHTDPFGRVISLKSFIGGGVDQQWCLQQFPSMTSGFDQTTTRSVASCPFQSGSCVESPSALALTSNNPLGILSSSSSITRVLTTDHHQLPPVKFEDNHSLSLPRSSTRGFSENHNQYWGGGNSATWTEIPALITSSSTSYFL